VPRFGKYELEGRIGAGGMAEIFLARHFGAEGLSKQLVIKRIRPEQAGNPSFVVMFIDEAKIAVSLNHPNVVQVYEFGRVGSDFYLAMEYVDGIDLGGLLAKINATELQLAEADALYVAIEIAKGLDYAHRKVDEFGNALGIVHRDVSPQNILVSTDGGAKLLDFGIANASTSVDKGDEVKGKVVYMSPEQARGEVVDARSDVFSLGGVLWEMLAGRPVFEFTDTRGTLEKVIEAEVPDIREFRPDVSDQTVALLAQALAKQPSDRFETARAFQVDATRSLFASGDIADSVTLSGFVQRVEAAAPAPAPADPHAAYTRPGAGAEVTNPTSPVLGTSKSDPAKISDLVPLQPITEAPVKRTNRTQIALTDTNLTRIVDLREGDGDVVQAERREVVILCGDVRGFNTMRGVVDGDAWRQILMDYIRLVEAIAYKNHALVDRVGEGGFSLVLGLPVAVENVAERGVSLACDLVEAVEAMNLNLESPLGVSAGLILGSAVVEQQLADDQTQSAPARFDWQYDEDEVGHGGLYLAEALARAGMGREVLMGGRVVRRVRGRFVTESVTEVTVELDDGELQLNAHRLVAPKTTREQLQAVSHAYHRMFGRELALKSLREAYEEAMVTGRVRGILITGEQGVGKSTLLSEFLGGIRGGRKHRVSVFRGVADLHDTNTAYASLTRLLLDMMAIGPNTDLRAALGTLGQICEKVLGHLGGRERGFVEDTLRFLLGLRTGGNTVEALDPSNRKAVMFRSLRQFLKAMSATKPMVFALEDLQRTDASTLAFLADYLEEDEEASVFFVLTGLPPEVPWGAWKTLLGSAHVAREHLVELSPAAARSLARAMLPEELTEDESVTNALLARAGGNPLFLKELIDLLAERGVTEVREAVLQLETTVQDDEHWVPTTVEGLLRTRIDRLPLPVRRALQHCALLGAAFPKSLVDAVLDDVSDEHLATLVERGHLVRRGGEAPDPSESNTEVPSRPSGTWGTGSQTAARSGEPVWSFANTVLREVAALGVVEPVLGELHARIADHLLGAEDSLLNNDAVAIAYHLDAAGEAEQAGEMYLVGAERAMGSLGGDECLRIVERALARVEAGSSHHRRALELKESALTLLGRQEERRALLDELLEMMESEPNPRRLLQVRGRSIRLSYELGDLDRVEAEATALVDDAKAAGDEHVVGSALRQLHMVHRDRGDHDRALELLDQAVALFHARDDTEGIWATQVSRGICLRQSGRLTDALEAYQSALGIVTQAGLDRQEINTRINLGLLYVNLGEYDKARANYSQALIAIRNHGFVRDEAAALVNQGHLFLVAGDHGMAQHTLTRAVRLARSTRDNLALCDALLTLGVLHLARGHLREADALVRKGLRVARDISHVYLRIQGALCLASVCLALGTDDAVREALEHAQLATTLGAERGLGWGERKGMSLGAKAHLQLGDPETALRLSRAATEGLADLEIEDAESVWARHVVIASAAGDDEGAEAARERAAAIVDRIKTSIADSKSRKRYLQSPRVRTILES
jgi:eukaryotic-like serine/threonine-protein kinase